jgi:hypothetical protein
MHTAGIPAFREMLAAKSTLNFHVAPYACGLLNQSVNGWYAYVRGDPPLMVHRAAGVTANVSYLYLFLLLSAPGKAADNRCVEAPASAPKRSATATPLGLAGFHGLGLPTRNQCLPAARAGRTALAA